MIQEPLQQEILTRIDRLAEKLGVTAEYLWPHLVRHSFAEGISVIVGASVLIVISIVLWWWALREDEEGLAILAGVVTLVAAILAIVAIGFGIPSIWFHSLHLFGITSN